MEIPSRPILSGFNPKVIPWQFEVIRTVRKTHDYSIGNAEILLTGSVGSAKSILMAHLIVTHCLTYSRARVAIARRALPDLKNTLYKEIIEHIEEDLEEGKDYWLNTSSGKISFRNGSEIISVSWADKRYKKARSLKLSMVAIEELTENSEEDKEAFDTLKARLRRLPHIPENVFICATNPDSPRHWAYKYFIEPNLSGKHETRYVFYSRTEQNPFLDPVYIAQLRADYDPKMARRMLDGEWIELDEERIYYEYQTERNFRNEFYQYDKTRPVILSFDFNIGDGKPMSSASMQYVNDTFHIAEQVVVDGFRTLDALEEWQDKGLFDLCVKNGQELLIRGDATAAHKDTRSNLSDYEIIKKFLSSIAGLRYRFEVPSVNPPIRTRHNRVNAYCFNSLGQVRLFVYKGAQTADEGFRLTALKKGSDIVEDDSKRYQHITTAIGYAIVYETNRTKVQATTQRAR